MVQGWINNPATNFGFILQDYANSADDDLLFSSREATVAANRPQPQLVYNPPSVAPLSLKTVAATASATGTGEFVASKLVQPSTGGNVVSKPVQTGAPAAAKSQSSNLLLAAAATRRLPNAAVDNVLAHFGDDGSTGWDESLDDDLLLDLASAQCLGVAV